MKIRKALESAQQLVSVLKKVELPDAAKVAAAQTNECLEACVQKSYTDDMMPPVMLKVTGMRTSESSDEAGTETHKYYDLGTEDGCYIGCVRSDLELAVGDLVEVAYKSVHMSAYMDGIAVVGKGSGTAVSVMALHEAVAPAKDPVEVKKSSPAPVIGAVLQKSVAFAREIPIRKNTLSATRKEIAGVVYPADRLDAHGEFAAKECLRSGAHNWLSKSREVNVEHGPGNVGGGVAVVESYLAPRDLPEFDAKENDWVGVFKVNSENLWKSVDSGEFRGFSIEGVCDKVAAETGVRLTNILVTKVSLVRNPASRVNFLAKSEEKVTNKEKPDMKEIAAKLTKIQDTLTGIAKSVDAVLPVISPSFTPVQSADEAANVALNAQANYVGELAESVLKSVVTMKSNLVKSQETAESLATSFDAVQATVAALEASPEIKSLLQKQKA
jgi:hypothetical protein